MITHVYIHYIMQILFHIATYITWYIVGSRLNWDEVPPKRGRWSLSGFPVLQNDAYPKQSVVPGQQALCFGFCMTLSSLPARSWHPNDISYPQYLVTWTPIIPYWYHYELFISATHLRSRLRFPKKHDQYGILKFRSLDQMDPPNLPIFPPIFDPHRSKGTIHWEERARTVTSAQGVAQEQGGAGWAVLMILETKVLGQYPKWKILDHWYFITFYWIFSVSHNFFTTQICLQCQWRVPRPSARLRAVPGTTGRGPTCGAGDFLATHSDGNPMSNSITSLLQHIPPWGLREMAGISDRKTGDRYYLVLRMVDASFKLSLSICRNTCNSSGWWFESQNWWTPKDIADFVPTCGGEMNQESSRINCWWLSHRSPTYEL